MEKKYYYLRVVSIIYKILGVLVLGYVMLSVSINFLADFQDNALSDSITIFVIGGLAALGLIATGQLFDLFIDMEENTRASRLILYQMVNRPKPREEKVIAPLSRD